jgi:uncharacterized SAM-binding protein YcdF (DUF218 family)
LAVTVPACRNLHSFLAVTRPFSEGILVVEGWGTDSTFEAVIQLFTNRPPGAYAFVCVTGGPLEYGAYLSEYGTYAERGAAVLASLGFDTNAIRAVPAPRVPQDRTYTSALALRRWLEVQRITVKHVTVVTQGPHARRSRLLFQRALGEDVQVGVVAVPVPDYDHERWWRSSAGVRNTINEWVGYLYVRIFSRV